MKSAEKESKSGQRVLVLSGDNVISQRAEQFWDKLKEENQSLKITYKNLEAQSIASENNESYRIFSKNEYDLVIIIVHGTLLSGNKNERTRQNHRYKKYDKNTPDKTASLINKCAEHTNKILVTSCFAGAVIKDLAQNPPANTEAQVVTLGGSKYSTFGFSNPNLIIARKFLETADKKKLYETAQKHFPETMCVYDKGEISKLGAVKIPGIKFRTLKNRESLKSQYEVVTPMRHYCEKNNENCERSNETKPSWWKVIRTIPVDLQTSGQDFQNFKNQALGHAAFRNSIIPVKFWMKAGAKPDAELNFDKNTPIQLAAHRGNSKIFSALIPDDIAIDFTTSFISAVQKGNFLIVGKIAKCLDTPKLVKFLGTQSLEPTLKQFSEILVPIIDKHLKRLNKSDAVSATLARQLQIIKETLDPTSEAQNKQRRASEEKTPLLPEHKDKQKNHVEKVQKERTKQPGCFTGMITKAASLGFICR